MGRYLLKGHVSYAVGRKYKWVAEFGKNTCEKCAALDGQEFEEGDVPYWPHPNCRCKVEEISELDEVESELNEYKEELEQLKLQANELFGDTRVLREQIEKAIKEAQSKEANTLEAKLTRLEYDIYRLLDKIDILTKETIDKFVIEKIQKEIERIKNNVQSYANEYKNLSLKLKAEKLTIDAGVEKFKKSAPDAAAIWKLASSKFKRGLDYIEKNGKLINKITDLNNKELQDAVRKKLDTQLQQTEARGVQFHPNSSISKSVANSEEFKKIVSKNMDRLIYKKETIPKVSTFLKKNFNNYMALHGCDILNIRVENGMLHAFIIDTVDYNPNDWKVKLPRDLQEGGAIENFYVIIKIEEPISIYFDL